MSMQVVPCVADYLMNADTKLNSVIGQEYYDYVSAFTNPKAFEMIERSGDELANFFYPLTLEDVLVDCRKNKSIVCTQDDFEEFWSPDFGRCYALKPDNAILVGCKYARMACPPYFTETNQSIINQSINYYNNKLIDQSFDVATAVVVASIVALSMRLYIPTHDGNAIRASDTAYDPSRSLQGAGVILMVIPQGAKFNTHEGNYN